MLLAATAIVFVAFVALSMPIVFALGIAGVAGPQNWVLLAIPSFVFAGMLMERCGMSHALVDLARALVGWLRGGLGMSVIVVSYFFSDICGSKMAEVSALGSTLIPALKRAGYRPEDGASLIASGTAMGMLVPPAIFMIVIGDVTNTSVVALFLAGFIPAATIGVCLCILVFIQAHILGWPRDTRPSWRFLLQAAREAAVPMVVPVVIFGGFFFGVFTATEAGAIVAAYAFLAALFYYRNVTLREMFYIAYESALLTAAVVLIPVVFPIAKSLGIHPIHFDIVQTAAVGIGLFLPPMGVGLLMALRFAQVPVGRHAKSYWPYLIALLIGLMLIICIPELSLFLPRSAGMVR